MTRTELLGKIIPVPVSLLFSTDLHLPVHRNLAILKIYTHTYHMAKRMGLGLQSKVH